MFVAQYKCGAARDLPLNEERDWDGDAVTARLWEHFGWDFDEPPSDSGGDTRKAFLLFDPDRAGVKDAYELPFCDVVGGRLVALASGLRAAASRLQQKDGDEERSKARDVLDGYFSKLHDQQQDEKPEAERDAGIFLYRAPLARAAGGDLAAGSYPSELLRHVYDPDALGEHPLFVTRATASTTHTDTYGTSMLPSTLRNFAEDADGGISVQNSHKTDELPLGRTWGGHFTGKGGNGVARTEMDIYVPRNLNITGLESNHVIDGIRTGIIRDVSVGFYGGEVRCSLCGKEMMQDLFSLLFFGFPDDDADTRDPDVPCYHLPGLEYATRDKAGKDTGDKQLAVGQIDGARCGELSFVFDGATPGAQINGRRSVAVSKAERMYEIGVLTRATATVMQHRYRGLRFPSLSRRLFTLEGRMPPENTRAKVAPSQKNPDPDGDGDDDTSAETDTDHSHWTPDGKKKDSAWPKDKSSRATEVETEATEATEEEAEETEVVAEPNPAVAPPAPSPANAGGSPPVRVEDPDAEVQAERARAVRSVLDPIRRAFISAELAPAEFVSADANGIRARVVQLGQEIGELRSSEAGFRKLRERIVGQIRAEGVRAYGATGLPEPVYGPILESGTVDQLVGTLDFLEAEASKRLAGGRATQDEPDPQPAARNGHRVPAPDAAYLAR